MARRRQLHQQLLALAAAASLVLAAFPIHTTTAAATPPSSSDVRAIFRGARRLGPPHHLRRLSEAPAAKTSASDHNADGAPALAALPSHDNGAADGDYPVSLAMCVVIPILTILGLLVGLFLLFFLFMLLRDCACPAARFLCHGLLPRGGGTSRSSLIMRSPGRPAKPRRRRLLGCQCLQCNDQRSIACYCY